MGLKLWWEVYRSRLPAKLKPLAYVLAVVAKDSDGSGIWMSVDAMAKGMGDDVHRVTACKRLRELEAHAIVRTVRRGGRWKTKGKTVGRNTERCLDRTAIQQFARSDRATLTDDRVARRLRAAFDQVAASLPDSPDHVAASLRLKLGTYVKPGKKGADRELGTKRGKPVVKTPTPAAPAITSTTVAYDTSRSEAVIDGVIFPLEAEEAEGGEDQ
jgi:DNA-binding transcriptional regulator YhcF (GntR family)